MTGWSPSRSEAGAVPFSAAETVRRGRLGPGELLLVEPGRRAILEDTEAKPWALRSLAIHDAPRPVHEDRVEAGRSRPTTRAHRVTPCATSPGSTPSAPGSTSRRWRSRATSRSGAWATTPRRPDAGASTGRSPTTSARRSRRSPTRPSTPSASAWSWTCGSSSGGVRPLLGGMPRASHGPRASGARSWPTSEGLLVALHATGVARPPARCDLGARPSGWRPPSTGSADDAVRLARRGAEVLLVTDAAWSMDRLPIPSILATGAVHTALTDAGLRGRADIAVSAVDVLDVHAMAMLLAVGATAVQPRLAIELAAELAGTRGAEDRTPADTVGSLLDAFEAGLRKTLARMGISAVASYIGGALIDVVDLDAVRRRALLPDGRGVAGPDDARRPGRAAAPPARRRPGDPGAGARPRAPAARSRVRPVPGRRRGPLFSPRIAGEMTLLAVGGQDGIEPGRRRRGQLDRYRCGRPAAAGRTRRSRATTCGSGVVGRHRAAGRGRGRPLDRPPVRRLRDERGRAEPGGAPGPDHRHPAGRRRRQHRRGRRGPGLVHARIRTAGATTPGSSRSPRPGSA